MADRARAVRRRPGWERLSPPGKKAVQHWRHESGWEVLHCGHPTAIWPYSLTDPAHPGDCIVSFNGKGFQSLAAALEVVERIVAGELVVTTERCVPGVRRALCTAIGEEVPAGA